MDFIDSVLLSNTMDSTSDMYDYTQSCSRGSGRRRQRDQRTGDENRYAGSSNALFSNLSFDTQANVGTGMAPQGETDLSYYSTYQQPFSSTQDLVAGVNQQPGDVYSLPGVQSAGLDAQNNVEQATDYSVEGFDASLRTNFGATGEIDTVQGDHVRSMPNDYNEFATTQDFGPNVRTSSDFGQSSLGHGSYEDPATYRQLLGAPSSSYLTVPSSAGTGSYTTSDVFSDQDSNVLPSGTFDADPFSTCTSQQEIAALGRGVDSRQRSASSAAITTHRPALLHPHRYSASSLYPTFGSNLQGIGNPQNFASSTGGHNDLLQTSPSNMMPPGPEDMLRLSSSDLPLGTQSVTASDTSSATLRHRSFSTSSRTAGSTRIARSGRPSLPGRSHRQITASRSPNRSIGFVGDGKPSRHSLTRESSLTKAKDKGKRSRPLDDDTKGTANVRRENKDVCQNCKYKKTKCVVHEGETCKACRKKGLHCVPYHFNKYRTHESFDFIARSYFNHVCDQGRYRRWTPMESINDFDNLQQRIAEAEHVGFVRCHFGRHLLYTIDIQRCASLVRRQAAGSDPLQTFSKSLDKAISSADSWLQFHDDLSNLDGSLHHLQRMLICTELVPWHTFTIFDPYPSSTERPLDPSDDNDLRLLHAGTLLSRLITKQLEQAGYEQLHQRLTNLKEKPSRQAIGLLKTLLLSLRRRWCMWEQLPSLEGKADWSRRVYRTTQILYFHFFNAIDQPPSLLSSRRPEYMRQTVWEDLFPLSMPFFQGLQEDVPTDNSPEGFDDWLRQGFQYLHWDDAQLGHFFQSEPQATSNDFQYSGSFFV